MDPAIAIAAHAERRRQQNRQAATASRVKKQQRITELEQRIQHLTDSNQQLTDQLLLARQSIADSQPLSGLTQPHSALSSLIPPPQPAPSSNDHEVDHPMATNTAPHVSIAPLSAYPQHVDATAALLHAEWAALYALENIHSAQQLANKLRRDNPPTPPTAATSAHRHGSTPPLPATLIALAHNDSELVGTASLDTSDLPSTHPYYPATPWVSSVLVCEQWRGKGVAGQLVRGVEAEARRRGLGWLWLWTVKPASVAMYAHLGWRVVEQVWLAEKGKDITVMRKDLVEHSQPHTSSSPIAALASLPEPPGPPAPQPSPQPSVAMEVVYERLEGMVESLTGYEDISEFSRVAATFAQSRLSELEAEQDTSVEQAECWPSSSSASLGLSLPLSLTADVLQMFPSSDLASSSASSSALSSLSSVLHCSPSSLLVVPSHHDALLAALRSCLHSAIDARRKRATNAATKRRRQASESVVSAAEVGPTPTESVSLPPLVVSVEWEGDAMSRALAELQTESGCEVVRVRYNRSGSSDGVTGQICAAVERSGDRAVVISSRVVVDGLCPWPSPPDGGNVVRDIRNGVARIHQRCVRFHIDCTDAVRFSASPLYCERQPGLENLAPIADAVTICGLGIDGRTATSLLFRTARLEWPPIDMGVGVLSEQLSHDASVLCRQLRAMNEHRAEQSALWSELHDALRHSLEQHVSDGCPPDSNAVQSLLCRSSCTQLDNSHHVYFRGVQAASLTSQSCVAACLTEWMDVRPPYDLNGPLLSHSCGRGNNNERTEQWLPGCLLIAFDWMPLSQSQELRVGWMERAVALGQQLAEAYLRLLWAARPSWMTPRLLGLPQSAPTATLASDTEYHPPLLPAAASVAADITAAPAPIPTPTPTPPPAPAAAAVPVVAMGPFLVVEASQSHPHVGLRRLEDRAALKSWLEQWWADLENRESGDEDENEDEDEDSARSLGQLSAVLEEAIDQVIAATVEEESRSLCQVMEVHDVLAFNQRIGPEEPTWRRWGGH